jgi:hypothetical protein
MILVFRNTKFEVVTRTVTASLASSCVRAERGFDLTTLASWLSAAAVPRACGERKRQASPASASNGTMQAHFERRRDGTNLLSAPP